MIGQRRSFLEIGCVDVYKSTGILLLLVDRLVKSQLTQKSLALSLSIYTHIMESKDLPPLGFIAVACHFYRPPGDPFNDLTWPFPIIRKEAKGSVVTRIVTSEQYDSELIENFIEAGLELAKQGCVGIITSCGFIAMAQPE